MRLGGRARYRGRLSKVFRCKGRNFSNVTAFNKTGEEIHNTCAREEAKGSYHLTQTGRIRDQRISAVRDG